MRRLHCAGDVSDLVGETDGEKERKRERDTVRQTRHCKIFKLRGRFLRARVTSCHAATHVAIPGLMAYGMVTTRGIGQSAAKFLAS